MKAQKITLFSVLCLGFIFVVSSCVKDTGEVSRYSYADEEFEIISQSLTIPSEVESYLNVDLPPHMINSGFSIAGGSISDHGATLGRVLFYEKRLSKNNTISCASCHQQSKGFADDAAFSKGFEEADTKRNSLALGNVRFYYHDRGFMWDERAESVEAQTRMTVTDHIEMGMESWADVVESIEGETYYSILFRKAFGDENITEDRVQEALSMFVRSIISKGAKFDEAMIESNKVGLWDTAPLQGFTNSENRGLALYMNSCQSCHGNILFLGRSIANNGLDAEYEDKGVGAITNNPNDNGVFKVPHLRNIGVTGPYMHDGRFETLAEVVDHYSDNIQFHPNLAFDFRLGNQAQPLNYTDQEKEDLVAFLNTLTDHEMMSEVRYSDPFK